MIEDVQHIHHQLVLVYDHVFSFSSLCQLNSHMLAQLQSLSAHLYSCCQLISSCQGQVAGNKAQCIQRRSYTTISSG